MIIFNSRRAMKNELINKEKFRYLPNCYSDKGLIKVPLWIGHVFFVNKGSVEIACTVPFRRSKRGRSLHIFLGFWV